jgi:hypothetical protein
MAKHKGEPRRKWDEAVDSAAQKALNQSGAGRYVIDEIEVNVERAQPGGGASPGTNPIRDYRITLEGPGA